MSARFVCFLVLSSAIVAPALAQPPAQNRVAERFQLALGLINRGMHDDAAAQLIKFVAEQPGHARAVEAHYRLGVCQLQLKQPDQAIASFRRALRGGKFKLKAECRYRLGHTLQQRGQHQDAADQFLRLVSEGGDKHYLAAPSLFAGGESLRQLKKDDEALVVYRKAADLDRDAGGRFAVTALYQAGFIQLRRRDYSAAGAAFQRAADGFPKHAAYGECRFLQGEAALRGGEIAAARAAFGKSVQAGGEFADDAAMGLGYAAVKAEQTSQAIADFRRVVARHPKSPLVGKAMLECGRALYKGKQLDAAIGQLNQLLQRPKEEVAVRWPALELRGLAALDLGKTKLAITDLRQAIQLTKDRIEQGRMFYSLGEAHADAGDWNSALAAYGECETRSKDSERRGEALYGRCLALHRLQRYAESNQLVVGFLRQFKQHSLHTTAAFALAENHFGLKQYPAADQAYGRIPSQHKLASKAAFKGAWCSYLSGDYPRAAQRFTTVAGLEQPADRRLAEESLSMAALAHLEAGALQPALQAADRYRGKNPEGRFLARTERVAARVLKRQGKLKLAASRLSRAAAVETSPERAFADRLEFAELLFKQGDFVAASAAYTPLITRSDQVGGRAHEGLAWCAFELGEDEDCANWIERGLKHQAIGDGGAGLLELLASLHHRRQDWAAAELAAQRFLQAFAKHTRAAELRYTMGVAQSRANKLKAARATLSSLQDAKLARPDRLFYELAWVCRRSKDEPAALLAFARVVAVSRDRDLVGESRLHLGEAMLQNKQPDQALAQLQQVAGKYQGRAQYLCGFTRFEQGKYDLARRHFERIVGLGKSHSLYFEAQFFVAETMFKQDDCKGAAERYAILIGQSPGHARSQVARLHHGQCLVRVDRGREATAVLRDYLRRLDSAGEKTTAEQARAKLWLGQAWQQVKDWRRAEAAFRVVTDLSDDELSAEAQYRIGQARRSDGRIDEAVGAFVKLSILYGHAEWVQRGLDAAGDCYLKLGKPNKARKLFEELVQRFPKSTLAERAATKIKKIRSM